MTSRTLICFDYGTKRIGVAVGQTLTSTATPLETVRVAGKHPDWQRISTLIEEWQPDALLVGTPWRMDGTRQPVADAADRFSRQLSGRFGLPVYRTDERLSTKEAASRLRRSRGLDPVAAQVILETWLGEHQNAAAADRMRRGKLDRKQNNGSGKN